MLRRALFILRRSSLLPRSLFILFSQYTGLFSLCVVSSPLERIFRISRACVALYSDI